MNSLNLPYRPKRISANLWRSLVLTAALVPLLAIFVWAGSWQLGRAAEKERLIAMFTVGGVVGSLTELGDQADSADMHFRKFRLQGSFDNEHQLLLDNIVSAKRVGYQVLTPFVTGREVVMINRGWIVADVDRRVLPEITVDNLPRTINGRLAYFPRAGISLGEQEGLNQNVWPKRLLYPSPEQINTALGFDIPAYQLLLDASEDNGYERNWKAVSQSSEKNIGYAIQWFSFAALTLFLYAMINLRWARQNKGQAKQNS
jgi:surfeit locus 1 family protein